jgi:intracellular sulfur oxidation DsrE/DsrF family protein
VNLQKHYGMDNIEIEVVAFGAGYRMLTPQSTLAPRIASLTMQEITFTACMNTLLSVKEKTGFMPKLIKGVTTTKAGIARIIELQEQGYSYIKY